MGRTLYIDAFAGLAGDMLVAALIDAGAPFATVLDGLLGLGVEGWSARTERTFRGPFAAVRFLVDLPLTFARDEREPVHGHDHGHAHGGGHDHAHAHGGGQEHGHDHGHTTLETGSPTGLGHVHGRAWRDIRDLLSTAPLAPRVRLRALAVFSRLAEAEARAHGIPVDEVGFHEVGAIDSIVDIVGACLAMEALDIDTILAGPLPLGGGHIQGAHGWIPLPAPATVEVLRGFPVVGWPWPGETVTPTGAAIVAALATPGAIPPMRVEAVGYGAGTRDPSTHPNVVRVLVGAGEAGGATEIVELRAEMDGLTGEEVPGVIDALLSAGALDAYTTPITMKKGRPGVLLTVLAEPARQAAVGEALLRQGVTLGYRVSTARREVLARRWETVETRFGPVRIKLGERAGEVLRAAPEHEDCRSLAAAAGVAIVEVEAAARAAWGATRGA